ncbi:arginase family protein [Brachybacterium sp. ACRRE]|uniref:arginase family protein n=1 Tax=Brachybacterium sp. ACRRE TaxID=2918184 RepID=UPI001EF1E729|nr:arginase family protein [Brachybacterium sp. ACRRE]MCG7309621.1 arginase family protein [Brachybacterium sp. ACRRE]
MSAINILGVPSSAGSYAAGQEQAPAALRAAGLLAALTESGHEVRDHGDLTEQAWRPDRERPFAQNLLQVVQSVRELTDVAAAVLGAGERILVLGGNCTIALGTCAGMRLAGSDPGLVYIDRHFDLNTPQSTTEGALDWMGLAHALDLEGTAPELVDALGPRPLLRPSRLSFLGVDVAGETIEWEQAWVEQLALRVVSQAELVRAPARSAAIARDAVLPGPFAVHVDVDVLDFIDAPLAENVNGRNSGPTIEQLEQALAELWNHPDCRALSIGELNPVHAAADPDSLGRFVAALGRALTLRD